MNDYNPLDYPEPEFPPEFTTEERKIVTRVVAGETRHRKGSLFDRKTGLHGLDARDFFQAAMLGLWKAKCRRGPEEFDSPEEYHQYLRKWTKIEIKAAIREEKGRPRSKSSAREWPEEVDNLSDTEEIESLTNDCLLFEPEGIPVVRDDRAQEGVVRKCRPADVSERYDDPSDDAIYNETEEILRPVIRWTMALPDGSKDRLTRPEFRCLIRKVVDGDSIPEIARGLRIKEESVVKNLDRAAAKLRRANDPELDRFLTDNYLD